MTGTAKTEEVEFIEIYKLGVVQVPTNRPMVREDNADLIYKSEKAKFAAVAEEIRERHEVGQPMLIGTTSVEKSEYLATLLTRLGIKHEVLNAKNHLREAQIVAQAGRLGAVTVSTNMAGRGTDIVLGGNAEEVARHEVFKLPPEATEDEKAATYQEAFDRYAPEFEAEGAKVKELGGLYVLGTERHDSRRIDNQLRGRAGRQGDPGTSRFYLSLEDDLMRLFNASAVDRIMTRLKIPEDVPIEHKWVTKAVANAQRQVESLNFDRRKNVLKYDDVMNEQRKVVYGQRQRLLDGEHEAVEELAQKYLEDTIEALVEEHCPPGVFPEEWDLDGLATRIEQVYDSAFDFAGLDLEGIERDALVEDLIADAFAAYERREEEVGGEDVMREIERRVVLTVVDRKWREHLYEMDALRDGIGLRAVGQRDPLTEYQREAYDSFVGMMTGVKEEATTYFFRLPINREDDSGSEDAPAAGPTVTAASAAATAAGASRSAPDGGAAELVSKAIPLEERRESERLTYRSSGTAGAANYSVGGTTTTTTTDARGREVEKRDDGSTVRRVAAGSTYTSEDKVGRNDPCPCGSGQKYKRCHGAA
jgi:preprotein translocase subunit SecA